MNKPHRLGFTMLCAAAFIPSSAQWSYVNLMPTAGSVDGSVATGVNNGKQVGYWTDTLGVDHPCIWSGTAASVLDLTPSGSGGGQGLALISGAQYGYDWMS